MRPLLQLLATAALLAPSVFAEQDFSSTGSQFADDLPATITAKCRSAARQLPRRFPALRRCFDDQSLFYTETDTVCKPDCLSATIAASRALAITCKLPAESVYSAWGRKDSAHATCSKRHGRRCHDRISTAADQIVQLREVGDGWESRRYLHRICNSCVLDMYRVTQGRSSRVPRLYYADLRYPAILFREVERHCLKVKVAGGQARHLEDINVDEVKQPVASDGGDDNDDDSNDDDGDDSDSQPESVEERGRASNAGTNLHRRGVYDYLAKHGIVKPKSAEPTTKPPRKSLSTVMSNVKSKIEHSIVDPAMNRFRHKQPKTPSAASSPADKAQASTAT